MTKMQTVRPLIEEDQPQVNLLDDLSGNNVQQWLDTDGTYGLFVGQELIGYLTLGCADDCDDTIMNHPAHTAESRLLSDVYVKKEWRGNHMGLKLITSAVGQVKETVFLSYTHPDLRHYYGMAGFVPIGQNHMIKEWR